MKNVHLNASMEFSPEHMGNLKIAINGNGEELVTMLMMVIASDDGIYQVFKDAVETFEANRGEIFNMMSKSKGKITTEGFKIDGRNKE